MAKFSDLPSEIQLLIARYLPRSQLLRLNALNSVFLKSWTDIRWKRLKVYISSAHKSTSERTIHLLQRVLDPFVVKRTKVLTINIVSPGSTNETFDVALAALLRCLPLLPNLTTLNIKEATFHVAIFFRTITSCSLAKRLEQLSLSGHVEMFASIQEYCTQNTPFQNLIKLTLVLYQAIDDNTQKESPVTLELFLRSLAPTLQSLQIANYSLTLDLSPLFSALSQHDSPVLFPNLKSLSIRLHFTSLRASNQSLRDFLLSNNNLHHLQLNLALTLPYRASQEPLGAWLTALVKTVPFPSLQSLDINPSNTQAGRFAALTYIKRSAPTLSSLKISGYCLRRYMADQMVNAFKEPQARVQQLKILSLGINELSVSFLDLLARSLPQLEKLWLSTFLVVGDSRKNSFYKQLELRRYRPGYSSIQDVLHSWKLSYLQICVSQGSREIVDVRAHDAVAGAVPALACWMKQSMDDDEEDDGNVEVG